MKFLLPFIALLLLSCSTGPRQGHITATQLKDTTAIAGTFDTLAAYRKMPGQPKTVIVKEYLKKDGTHVKAHTRTPKEG